MLAIIFILVLFYCQKHRKLTKGLKGKKYAKGKLQVKCES